MNIKDETKLINAIDKINNEIAVFAEILEEMKGAISSLEYSKIPDAVNTGESCVHTFNPDEINLSEVLEMVRSLDAESKKPDEKLHKFCSIAGETYYYNSSNEFVYGEVDIGYPPITKRTKSLEGMEALKEENKRWWDEHQKQNKQKAKLSRIWTDRLFGNGE